jgi:hypothetical protein
MSDFQYKNYRKTRDKILYKPPVYNPVKEGLKKGFRFFKLFWLILLAFLLLFLYFKYGQQWGIKL